MSGGSMGYLYHMIEEYAPDLRDRELVELAFDMAKLFHDAEWWHSADIDEDTYRRRAAAFKEKWFGSDRNIRLKRYADEILRRAKEECYALLSIHTASEEKADEI